MIFAAIMSRMLYQIARWKLENGASLETLEQLMGSRTLGAALMIHCQLRSANVLTLGLLLVWACSPLGGQAFLRILRSESRPVATSARYYDTFADDLVAFGSSAADEAEDRLFSAAVTSHDSFKTRPRDLWGNVKIPLLRADAHSDNEGGWADVKPETNLDYSSLVGIPITDTEDGNTTLSIESDYLHLECEDLKRRFPDKDDAWKRTIPLETPPLGYREPWKYKDEEDLKDAEAPNGTWYGNETVSRARPPVWTIGLDRFIDKSWQMSNGYALHGAGDAVFGVWEPVRLAKLAAEEGIEAGEAKLLFQGSRAPGMIGDFYSELFYTECRVYQRYAESRVACSKDSSSPFPECIVVSQRPSREKRPDENLSILSRSEVFMHVSANLPRTAVFPVTNYLYNNSALGDVTSALDATAIPAEDFSIRLSQVLNTYLLVGRENFTESAWSEYASNEYAWRDVPAETNDSHFVYVVSPPWAAACIVSCVVLFFGSGIGIAFTHINSGPEVLGFVSTTLRDSRYISTPDSLSSRDGAEVSFKLKRERFRYGRSMGFRQHMGIGREGEVMKACES